MCLGRGIYRTIEGSGIGFVDWEIVGRGLAGEIVSCCFEVMNGIYVLEVWVSLSVVLDM